MKILALFSAGSLLFGAAALGGGCVAIGPEILLPAGPALGLTLLPAAITLAWVVISYRSDPSMMLLASLGASGFRMAIALGGGFYLTSAHPQTFDTTFWYWLLLFYPVFLALEITLLVWQQPKVDQAPKP